MTLTGSVNENLEAIVRIIVNNADGDPHQIEALIDTGFNGFLTLPSDLIASFRLPWVLRQQAQLADGSIETFDVHQAVIMWDATPRVIEVEAVDAAPLIGMSLLEGYRLKVDVTKGGSVRIELLR